MNDTSSDRSFGYNPLFFLFLALFFLVTGHSTAARSEISLSLAQAWDRLESENDALKAARANVEQTEHKRDAVKSLYLPSVTLSASYLYLDDDVELSPQDLFDSMAAGDEVASLVAGLASSSGISPAMLNAGLTTTIVERSNLHSSLTATWPVFTGGRISAAQDIAAASTTESRQALRLEFLKQFEQLVSYYFGTVLAAQVLDTRIEVEEGLRKHKEHAVLLEQNGQIARVERMQSEASLDRAVVEHKKARRDLEIARIALTRILKAEDLVMPIDTLFLADSLPDMDMFLEDTLESYPGLDTLQSMKKKVEGLIRIEKGRYLPTVAVLGDYTVYEEDDLVMELAPDWLVGVGVTVPLVDRSGRGSNLRAAKSTVNRLDHLYSQAESDLSILVEKTYRQVLQALEEYEGLGSSRKLAEETLRLRIKAFSQGLATSLDVVDAELFLADVKTQSAVAMHSYVLGLARLLAVSGRPETFFVYQNNKGMEEP